MFSNEVEEGFTPKADIEADITNSVTQFRYNSDKLCNSVSGINLEENHWNSV